MKKLNVDIICKLGILLSFSIFYLKLIITNKILDYVHPRIVPFIIFECISMIIMCIFLSKDIFKESKKVFKLEKYIVFFLTIIIIFSFESTPVQSSVDSSSSDTLADITSGGSYTESPTQDNTKPETKEKLEIIDDVIYIDSKNYLSSITELENNIDKYNNKKIQIRGFIYKDTNNTLKDNMFVISRYMMVCCAADMQVVGIPCAYNNLNYSPNTWVIVRGTLSSFTNKADADVYPLINVRNIEKDPNPDTSYIYPY